MRWMCGVAAIALSLALPASAKSVSQQTQTEINELVTAYEAQFNEHDVAGVAALFTADAMLVSSTAPSLGVVVGNGQQALTQYLDAQFQKGAHLDSFTEGQVEEARHNVVLAIGQWHATGNSPGGHYDLTGHWTAVVVRLGHHWRIRMLTAFPSPPTGQG